MQHKKLLSLAVSTALGLGTSFLLTDYAVAQDEQADDSDELLEEVIVTGSRIATVDGFGRTSPVTVVGMEAITSTGLTRVEDVLNSLPSVETAQHSFDANGITGTASIDLRGLGPQRTLVLFNGRRMQPGGVNYSQAADVNQIPTAMVERIEVLTGGASATYGADAVAGVVNFVMRRVNGVEISVGASGYQHDNDNKYITGLMDKRGFEYPTGSSGIDGQAYNVDIVIGGDFDNGKGNATVYATWRDNQELLQGARDYASCALNSAGTACGGSGNAIIPNFYVSVPDANGDFDWLNYEYLTLGSDSSLVPSSGNVYNYAPINHFMRPDERWSLGAFIDYEINEHAIAYLETNYASDRTVGQIAESGTFFNENYVLPVDNSVFTSNFRNSLLEYFPGADTVAMYIGKRNVEGGPRQSNLSHDGFRIVTGLKGAINDDWDYDFSYLYGATSSSIAYINDFFAPKITEAINGDVCAANAACIPYEVFTYQGVTPEMAAPLLGTAIATGETSTRVINGFVTGDLGWTLPSAEDSIMVAGGFEHRIEKYQRVSDSVYQEGSLLGQGGPSPSVEGSYNVMEFFGEANIPLITGMPGIEALTLDLAYRYSDYSTSGGANTYRVGLDWRPIDVLRVRAGYNRAVRAPNVSELFSTQALGLWSGDDPCAGSSPAYTQEQCARTGVSPEFYGNVVESPAGQYNAIFGGEPTLDPEVADTWTAGIVWDAMETMQLSVDYWRIEVEDTISTIGSSVILEQCGIKGNLCELINRNPSGSLWVGTQGYTIDITRNLGTQTWEGIDLAGKWSIDALGGTWTTDVIGTYMLSKETTPIPADPESSYDCVGLAGPGQRCYPSPEWRHTASVSYDSNEWWSTTLRWRYFGGVDYDGTSDQIAQDNLSSAQNYVDLSANIRFLEAHDLTLGVNNVFDKEPPMVGGSLTTNANTYAGFYDTLGRFLFARATFRF